jgi:hypothetical protein
MSKQRIIEISKAIISGQVEIPEGCIAICRERRTLDAHLRDSDELLPFISLDSDLDSYPLGEARREWNEKLLEEKDRELGAMIDRARPQIIEACWTLLRKWS